MKRLIKYWTALWLIDRMVYKTAELKGNIDEATAKKWNHLQGQKLTKGRLKWQWSLILKKNQ